MALTARLQFGNNDIGRYNQEYLITDVKCHYTRTHNHVSPTSKPRCESIEITVNAPDNKDITLYEWYLDQEPRSGIILIDNTSINVNAINDEDKKILFNEAQCFAISETYDIERPSKRQLKLEFEAEEIIMGDIIFEHL